MAFVDEIKIKAKAGRGGDGVVRWRHEKFKEFGGPSGGDGGRGGDIYIKAIRDLHLLHKYRTVKEFKADDGGAGKSNSLHGKNGKDLDILLPIGSIITNLETRKKISLTVDNERILLLKGGNGGRGNESFKSSTNQAPYESTPGLKGESGKFFIEIELVADIGLIGLPSAGKSSLLNALTAAQAKVADYPFTTLEPNLGECFGYIISDIPGLIEGASGGKGLGHKFLKHIKRTKMLVHLVSVENDDPARAYDTIKKELTDYDKELLEKREVIVLTKTDLIEDKKEIDKIVKKLKKKVETVFTLSIYDDESIKIFREAIIAEVEKL